MSERLYKSMGIPDSCYLGKRIYKKLFHENADLGATDKKAFRDDIDTVVWRYTLKPSTIPIQPYADDSREYHEIAILEVILKSNRRTRRIAEIVQRSIPYPVLVVLRDSPRIAISAAQKRFSLAEHGAIVAEDIRLTEWLDLEEPESLHRQFIESLALSALPQTHFYALYSALFDRVVALEAARLTGVFRLDGSVEQVQERLGRISDCRGIEQEIAELRAALKKETHFNRQVELNTKIKTLEQRLKSTAAQL